MTIYLGKEMPPFYLGSTSVGRLDSGYRGSVSSAKWEKIWNDELKNNPRLFKTFIIEKMNTVEEKLGQEERWQRAFDVVKNPLFINMSYARKKLFPTPESVQKALATKKQRGTHLHSTKTKEKLSEAAKNRPPRSAEIQQKTANLNRGKKRSEESRAKMRAARAKQAPMSEETKKKISLAQRGRKVSPDVVEKRASKIRGRKMSEEFKKKLSDTLKGRKRTDEQKKKLSKSRIGLLWYTNGEIEQQCRESPGVNWVPGRLSPRNQYGENNYNATTVAYEGTIYATVNDAVVKTGLSRYLLIKNGAIFQRTHKKNE
jgi:hypothetical protein